MPAPTNLGFETPGPTLGSAANWITTVTATYELWASFGVDDLSEESFETEWGNDPYLFEFAGIGSDLAAAVITTDYVTPATREDFETRWTNSGYLFELTNISTPYIDDFETGWTNVPYSTSLGSVTTATFDGNPYENFEQSWRNTGYLTALGSTSSAMVRVPGGTSAIEDFEFVREDIQIINVNPGTDVLTAAITLPHVDGDSVYMVGANLPSPLAQDQRYFIEVVVADQFSLSNVAGLVPLINLTTPGNDPIFLRSDPTLYWVGEDLGV